MTMRWNLIVRRTCGVLAAAMLAASMTACGGAADDPAGQTQVQAAPAYATLDEAIAANVPENASEESRIAANDGKQIVLYSRESKESPFTVQAYGEREGGWDLLSSRTVQMSKTDAVQELFPAKDNLIAFCVSMSAEDVAQQAYEFHVEGANGWVFGYNLVTPLA